MSIFVLNWKMQKKYKDSILWAKENNLNLLKLLNYLQKIIICPSFESISSVRSLLDSKIDVCAQDCSEFEDGAYTGQVSALSLKDIGCNYSLVGHSEVKKLNNNIKNKISILLKNDIIPIICVGESKDIKNKDNTFNFLKKELDFIIKVLSEYNLRNKIFIAYEPVWAIGSGSIPDFSDLNIIINYIKNYTLKFLPDLDLKLLYGASVNDKNIEYFKDVENLDGFLLGNSSLDFQLFKKIVLLFSGQ